VGKRSTVLTSQLPTKSWHESLGDPTIADAICDRLVHNAHVLTLRGSSMRRQKGVKTQPAAWTSPVLVASLRILIGCPEA
jgi:DNA replication protein DnaC